MRTLDQIRASYGRTLELDPNHGGAMQLDPRNRRFMQRAIDQIVRHQSLPARRNRRRAQTRARAVSRGHR